MKYYATDIKAPMNLYENPRYINDYDDYEYDCAMALTFDRLCLVAFQRRVWMGH